MDVIMECMLAKKFSDPGVGVIFSSRYADDNFIVGCLDQYNIDQPYPGKSFDIDEAEDMRDWLIDMINKYHEQPELCHICGKSLPTCALLIKGSWIVTCCHCSHKHEISKNSM